MIKSLIIFLILSFPVISYAVTLTMPIVSIIDGDTIRSSLRLPCPLCNVSIRIIGIDTPEIGRQARCPAEREKGIEARNFLRSFFANETSMAITNFRWDKYGGRINGNVSIRGVDVATLLIQKGYARPYNGSGTRPDWCN